MGEEGGEEEKVVEIELSYIDTPGGRRVATYESAKSLAEALEVLDEAVAELEGKIGRLERLEGLTKVLEKLLERIVSIEKSILELERSFQTDLGDISDKVSALVDAFGELAERVQRIEDALKG